MYASRCGDYVMHCSVQFGIAFCILGIAYFIYIDVLHTEHLYTIIYSVCLVERNAFYLRTFCWFSGVDMNVN